MPSAKHKLSNIKHGGGIRPNVWVLTFGPLCILHKCNIRIAVVLVASTFASHADDRGSIPSGDRFGRMQAGHQTKPWCVNGSGVHKSCENNTSVIVWGCVPTMLQGNLYRKDCGCNAKEKEIGPLLLAC